MALKHVIEAAAPPIGEVLRLADRRRAHVLRGGPTGPGAASAEPTVVLLHGASGNLRDWAISAMPAIAERHRVIAVDRPGFGHSDAPPGRGWTLAAQREGVRAALGAAGVAPGAPLVVVGHSWAGALALDWALAHPNEVAGVMVLSGAVMDWGGKLDLYYKLTSLPALGHAISALPARVIGERTIRRALRGIFAPQLVPEGYIARAGVRLALRPETFRMNAMTLNGLHAQILENAPRYGRIACPVEILHGDADTVVPARIYAEPLARAIAHARLELLAGIGHMPQHACAGAVAEAVSRLVRGAR